MQVLVMNATAQSHSSTEIFGNYKLDIQLPFKIRKAPLKTNSFCERDGHWSQKEKLKYAVFLSFFKDILQSSKSKKRIRIYEMMSDMIITRSPNQCRSHHQKMEKFRKSINKIIQAISCRYEPRVYHEITEKYLILIKDLLQNAEKYDRSLSVLNYEDKNRKIKKKIQHSELRKTHQINVKIEENGREELSIENEPSRPQICKPQEKFIQNKPTNDSYEEKDCNDDQQQDEDRQAREDEPRVLIDMKEENMHDNYGAFSEFYPSERLINLPLQSEIPFSSCYQPNIQGDTRLFEPFGSSRNFSQEINVPAYIAHSTNNAIRSNQSFEKQIRAQITAKMLEKQAHQMNCQRLNLEYFAEMKSAECCDQIIQILNALLQNKSYQSDQTQETHQIGNL